ncbi:MAG: NAD(P)H-hydrate dehydratase [Dehalococcoidales bacterium]
MKIVTAEQMRKIDRACEGINLPVSLLMENAGEAFAEETARILGTPENQHILMLIGPGNNGGDGLVAARHLHDRGALVSLFFFSQRKTEDANLKLVRHRKIACTEIANDQDLEKLDEALSPATAVIDALFGTGNNRPLPDIIVRAFEMVRRVKENRPSLRIIALDLPSGLNADSGGADPACLSADYTVTLAFPKKGLFNPPGSETAGKISIVDIGIPSYLAEDVNSEMITAGLAASVLPRRPIGANKGTFGKVLVAAGSANYIGAAYLACSGALRVGAGLVTLAAPASLVPIIASRLTEATYLPLPETESGAISEEAVDAVTEELGNYDALLVGCGLGRDPSTARFVRSLLLNGNKALPPVVIDADALNILAGVPDWWRRFTDNAILTPHPGEMARLTGEPVEKIQSDRAGLGGKQSQEWHKTVILKGAYTVVASPDNSIKISPWANPGLATAGTGDVLGGAVAGLAGQGLPLAEAAAAGVYIHGLAGETVREKMGDTGMIASDLLPELPLAIKKLKEELSGN